MMVYKALLLPLLSYCLSLWGSGHDNAVEKTRVIQNDAIRAVLRISRSESVGKQFGILDILALDELREIATAVLSYKVSVSDVPENVLPPLLARRAPSSRRRTAFETSFARQTFVRQSFAYRLPKTWCSIPKCTRSLHSKKGFM